MLSAQHVVEPLMMMQLQDHLRLRRSERWYVIQYLARQERLAILNLEAQNFRIFFPQMMKTVRHARKIHEKRVAVFPGYFFVALDLDKDRWRSINGTYGVAHLIMSQTRPIPTPQGLVEDLIGELDADGNLHLDRDLVAGQRVRVNTGPFASVLGKIASLDDKGRARVLLDIMCGAVVATVPRGALEPAD